MSNAGRPKTEIVIPADALPDRPYLTVKEVAELSGVHENTIKSRLREGTLKGKKLGTSWRIDRGSVLSYRVEPYLKPKNQHEKE